MAFQLSRCTISLVAAAAASCGLASSAVAQPLRPIADEQVERRPAPPQTDREPGYLGLITDDRRDRGQGVRVVKVVDESPAAKAGLEAGDLIVAIGGQPTGSLNEMAAQLQPHAVGDKVRFEVRRGDTTQTLEVALGRRPAPGERPFEFGRIPERLPEPNGATPPLADPTLPIPESRQLAPGVMPAAPRGQLLGIRTAPVTEDLRQRLRLPETAGARIVSRVVGSPADKAGIPLDAVIVAVEDEPVASPADLARLFASAGAGKEVELTYYSGGQQRKARVTLANVAAGPLVDPAPISEPRLLPMPLGEQIVPAPSAADRIELLERRVRELELRLKQLERALGASKSAAQGRD